MEVNNETQVTEFVLLGFLGIPGGQTYLFLVYLVIYLVTFTGNVMIFTLICLDAGLHTPMYFFLGHLSCLDLCISSLTVPKVLASLLDQRPAISYSCCLAQVFFLMSLVGTEAPLLAVMAFDRYMAICNPLRYSQLMKASMCMGLASATWVWGFLNASVHIALISKLHFCGINKIQHIFCDAPPLMNIACSDMHVNKIVTNIATIFMGLGPFLAIVLSYVCILSAILRIQSSSGRQKAFSTCASHMIVVIIYFGNGYLHYNQPRGGYSLQTDMLVSTMFCIVPPMLNPLIYSLRNQEVKGALKKVLTPHRKL